MLGVVFSTWSKMVAFGRNCTQSMVLLLEFYNFCADTMILVDDVLLSLLAWWVVCI